MKNDFVVAELLSRFEWKVIQSHSGGLVLSTRDPEADSMGPILRILTRLSNLAKSDIRRLARIPMKDVQSYLEAKLLVSER